MEQNFENGQVLITAAADCEQCTWCESSLKSLKPRRNYRDTRAFAINQR
jgi:hypothetical protein